MFTTPNEWIALALTFLGGWLLGLASHPGGRKWRTRYLAERDAHHAARADADAKLTAAEARARELEADRARLSRSEARVAEVERERDARLAELDRGAQAHAGELARAREEASLAQARARELEREVERLRATPPPMPAGVLSGEPRTVAAPSPAPAGTEVPLTRRVVSAGARSNRGWFDWGPGGDPRAHRG